MKSILTLTGFLLLLISNSVWCQEIKKTRDIGLWAGIGANFDLNKKWNAFLNQEVRSFDNGIKLQKSISDIGVTYQINKQFKLGAGLRYSYDRKKDYTFTNDIRYNVDFKFKYKLIKHLSLRYRLRFQHNYINLFTFTPDIEEKSNLRNRIRLQYTLKQHAIYFGVELFREFVVYKKPAFNNLRLDIGDRVKTRFGEFKYGLAYERELNEEHPLNFFFLKLNYTFKFRHD
jgi:long-subunit fatty acid transport protein